MNLYVPLGSSPAIGRIRPYKIGDPADVEEARSIYHGSTPVRTGLFPPIENINSTLERNKREKKRRIGENDATQSSRRACSRHHRVACWPCVREGMWWRRLPGGDLRPDRPPDA